MLPADVADLRAAFRLVQRPQKSAPRVTSLRHPSPFSSRSEDHAVRRLLNLSLSCFRVGLLGHRYARLRAEGESSFGLDGIKAFMGIVISRGISNTVYQGRKVAVVIPAYNVANSIASVVEGIPEFVDQIIVVNDASSDRTADAILAIKSPRLTVIQHLVNQGVGGAMVTGFRAALESGAELIVKMDGDGQMDPHFVPALLDPLVTGDCGYAKGNRFLSNDELRDMPKARLIGAFILTFLSKLASGYWHVFDPVNGYVAITADTLRRIPLDRVAKRYFFENDMLIHLNIFKIRVRDVPIPARYGGERSSMRLSKILFSFPLLLLRGFWYRLYNRYVLREFSAVVVFWVFGILFLAWGIGFGSYTWAESTWTGHEATTGTVMLSVLPFIVGFELALQAILIEINDSTR